MADDILVTVFNEQGKVHDEREDNVLQVGRQTNLKFNKEVCLFRYSSLPFCGEVVLQQGVSPYPRKIQVLTKMPPSNKKELQSFLGILHYQSTF